MSANDEAFIKVSKELLLLRNDLVAMKALSEVGTSLNHYAIDKLANIRADAAHSPGFEGLSKAVQIISKQNTSGADIQKLQARVDQLEKLSETYIKGGDIVASKLAI